MAYNIGVGKTLAALMCISNRFDTNNANKAIVIVPTPVYDKWIKEAQSYTQIQSDGKETEVVMHGSLNHLIVS